MTKFTLLIKNKDGSPYWTDYFETKADLNAWLAEEQKRPYWKKDFVVDVIDDSAAVEEIEKKAKENLEANQKKAADLQASIKDALQKKPKTIAECAAMLELICEHLGIKA